MDTIIFNQASIYYLQQLEHHYRKRYGKRYRLANETSRLELINHSSRSADRTIRECFERFSQELEPELMREMQHRGIVSLRQIV